MKVTPLGKAVLFLVLVALCVLGYQQAVYRGLISRPSMLKTVIPLKPTLAHETTLGFGNVRAAALPSTRAANVSAPAMRGEVWEWNAQMGMLYAIGGPCTTQGSFMDRHGVNVCVTRQDNTDQMKRDVVAFGNAMHNGDPNPSKGVHFVVIMGDGGAQFLQAVNPELQKLGKEYVAEIIGSVGYSRNEDKLMGPREWLTNPKAALGKTVCGVLRDGDWNIAMKWENDNELPNNPDDKMYDPNAVNWINADDYNDAAQKYVAGFKDVDRPIKGQRGKTYAPVCDGVVTWFPGDATVAKGRGGLASILSTKENAWQMPAVVIGIKKWFDANRQETVGLLAASFEGADQLKTNSDAFQRAAEISAAIYKDQDAKFWAEGFCGGGSMGSVACQGRGKPVIDKAGLAVELGGSVVSDLADEMQMINRNVLKATYVSFGDIVHQQYPRLVPEYPSFDKAFDPSFVMDVGRAAPAAESNIANAEQPLYTSAPISEVKGKAKWHINFRTGSADIDPSSAKTMGELYNNLVIHHMAVQIDGHTDSTGSAQLNQDLSRRRAAAIKQWLQDQSPADFPDARVRVQGFGDSVPIASNASEAGRAQNRRAEIIVGTTN